MPDRDRLTEFSPGCGMLCQLYVPGATRANITIHAKLSVYSVGVMDLLLHRIIPPNLQTEKIVAPTGTHNIVQMHAKSKYDMQARNKHDMQAYIQEVHM